MPAPLVVTFAAGDEGQWTIDSTSTVTGEPLAPGKRLSVTEHATEAPADAIWTLRGVVSNTRYSNRGELDRLTTIQEGLGRPQATLAALIPIRKSAAWWALAQDERRAIFEEQSRHIGIGLDYLPGVARRLHHSRDLGEPFDFLTWFEYAPQHRDPFEEMVRRLRQTREWDYVEREVDIRLSRV
jgi:chlorite dismutase